MHRFPGASVYKPALRDLQYSIYRFWAGRGGFSTVDLKCMGLGHRRAFGGHPCAKGFTDRAEVRFS